MFEKNLISDFKTDLLVPLKLGGAWEVALTKIIYRNSLTTNIGFLDLLNTEDGSVNSIPIEIEQSQNLFETFQTLSKLVSRANDLIKGITDNKKVIEINVQPISTNQIGSDTLGNVEILLHENFQLSFRGTFLKIFNISSTSIFDKNKPFRIELFNEKLLVNEAFFIYTDIIEEQFVGDTKAPLLDTVALKGHTNEAITIDF